MYDVTDLLQSENRLAVRLAGSQWLPVDRSNWWEKLLNRIEAHSSSMPGRFPHRRDTLKCQMGFGWDFAPPVRTMGIWDDVYAVVTGRVVIREVTARPEVSAREAALDITVDLDATEASSLELRCVLVGETFAGDSLPEGQAIDVASGPSRHCLRMRVPEPGLWWPWDHGRPDLYRLTVEVVQGETGCGLGEPNRRTAPGGAQGMDVARQRGAGICQRGQLGAGPRPARLRL